MNWTDLVASFLEGWWKDNPVDATFVGVHAHDSTLGDSSPESYATSELYVQTWLARFKAVDPASLTPSEAIDRDVLIAELSFHETMRTFQSWKRQPSIYVETISTGVEALLLYDFAPLNSRLLKAASRLSEARATLEQGKANLDASLVSPDHVVVAAESAEAFADYCENELLALTAATSVLEVLTPAAKDAASALRDFALWARTDLAPKASGGFAIGRERLADLLSNAHLLSQSPEELTALGWQMVELVETRLRKLATNLGYTSWQEAVDILKVDHPTTSTLVGTYQASMQRSRQTVIDHALVSFPPDEDLVVCETPAYERPLLPFAAYYGPANFDPQRKGFFYVTVPAGTPEAVNSALADHTTWGIDVTAAHEAYPGHHLQLVIAANHPSSVRKSFWTNFMVEGWGLYSERLMSEVGFINDPRARLFQLKDLLWRALRIVIDVGLHSGTLSFDAAVNLLVERVRFDVENATSEVLRYSFEPTQPMSYVVGMLQLLQLREVALEQGWPLQKFHDQVLACGSIPVSLIAKELGLTLPSLQAR